jgi:hypothetical protein
LTQIFLFFFFLHFLKNIFILFCPSASDCLVIELHIFIKFAFDGVTSVSWPGYRFGMLTRMGLDRVFWTFFCCWFFKNIYSLSLYFFFCSNYLNDSSLLKSNQSPEFHFCFCFLKNTSIFLEFFYAKKIRLFYDITRVTYLIKF